MKYLFYFLFLIPGFLVLFSCKTKNAVAVAPEVVKSESKLSTEGPVLNVSYEIAGFEKTPCYGQCPVYKVTFLSDGRVTWFGRNNVERLGTYEAEVELKVLKEIQQKAKEVGYFTFAEEYPLNHKIADLPFTTTFVNDGVTTKSVRNQLEAPERLIDFEDYLEALISRLNWKAMH
jgi:hypothetical protein